MRLSFNMLAARRLGAAHFAGDRAGDRAPGTITNDQRNPFVHNPFGLHDQGYRIGFNVPNKAEPLWWIGPGFKDLSRVRANPVYFTTQAEAEHAIRTEILEFIHRLRSTQVHLIKGWTVAAARGRKD